MARRPARERISKVTPNEKRFVDACFAFKLGYTDRYPAAGEFGVSEYRAAQLMLDAHHTFEDKRLKTVRKTLPQSK